MLPALSLLFFLPLASAMTGLTVTSNNPTSGGSITFTWTADSTDPATCDFVLVNVNFHNTFAIANSIQTTSGSLTVTLPIVSADSYTLEAVPIDNINAPIDTSSPFNIGATVTSTSSGSTSASSTSSLSGSVTTATSSARTTGSTTGSTSSPSTGSVTTSTSSSSGSASSPSASSFNGNSGGALGTHVGGGKVGSIAVAVVGIVAGAVFV